MPIVSATVYLVKKTTQEFFRHNAPQMAAALSYYALFSIPPILVLTLFFLSMFLSSNTAQETVIRETEVILGTSAKTSIREVITQITSESKGSFFTQLLGGAALFIAATGILGHIQKSLNTMWHLSPSRKPIMQILEQRIMGILFIGVAGIFLLISMVIHSAIVSFAPSIEYITGLPANMIGSLNDLVSFLLAVLVITLTFRFIPSGQMAWRDTFIGATITALLFTLGKMVLAVYLTHTSLGSAYGAAGSIILLLFWIYYSALIFFYGAEFTYVFSKKHGNGMPESTN